MEQKRSLTQHDRYTTGIDLDRRKAILDGLLFEIFFDSNAQLRTKPKSRCFNEAFHLQQYPELAESFKFIAECLVTRADEFYALPGKHQKVAIDVTITKVSDTVHTVDGVFLGGSNILTVEQENMADAAGDPKYMKELTVAKFETQISEETVVPSHLLKITYSHSMKKVEQLQFPLGWSMRKRK